MRNLKIPRTDIFFDGPRNRKAVRRQLLQPKYSTAMLRLCEVGEIDWLNTRLPKTRCAQPAALRL